MGFPNTYENMKRDFAGLFICMNAADLGTIKDRFGEDAAVASVQGAWDVCCKSCGMEKPKESQPSESDLLAIVQRLADADEGYEDIFDVTRDAKALLERMRGGGI